jgi:transcriptional regulator with PAS, ATPase and Fis domain
VSRVGKIVEASGGTLFLDEIGDLPLTVQAKLLRAVETNRITPVGSNEEILVDVRYIAATSRPIREMVISGTFRRDLYERLAGAVIAIPPLRERPEDIAPIGLALFCGLVDKLGIEWTTHVTLIEGHLQRWLGGDAVRHPWPGNVRELENVIRAQLLSVAKRTPSASHESPPVKDEALDVPERILQGKASLAEVRDWYVRRVVETMKGHKNKASNVLGIDRGTLNRILKGTAGTDDGSEQ